MNEKKKVKLYSVTWHVDATGHCFIVAENEEEAKKAATDNFFLRMRIQN